MTTRERIAELETEIGDLRRRMKDERDSELITLQVELIGKLVARVQQLRKEESA